MNRKFAFKNLEFELGKKTYIMGILNVTPDSFSDGGKYDTVEKAINKAKEFIENGVDIIDVGGESTRPGYQSIDFDTEILRVIPVIKAITNNFNLPISIDTSKSLVAKAAIDAGAKIVNDIWGLKNDKEMAKVISSQEVGVIIMHNNEHDKYTNLIDEMKKSLQESIDIAIMNGIDVNSIIIDPGIGFAKTVQQNIEVMSKLEEFKTLNMPILLGTSRKSFIGKTLNLTIEERLEGTIASVVIGILKGADFMRVHDVKEIKRATYLTDMIVRNQPYGN